MFELVVVNEPLIELTLLDNVVTLLLVVIRLPEIIETLPLKVAILVVFVPVCPLIVLT